MIVPAIHKIFQWIFRRVFRRAVAEEMFLLSLCGWSVMVQLRYRIVVVPPVVYGLGLALILLSILSLASEVLGYVPTKTEIRRDLRLFRSVGRWIIAGFVIWGGLVYVNCIYDISAPQERKAVLMGMTEKELDVGVWIPYVQAKVAPIDTPSKTRQVVLRRGEARPLWVKEPIIIKEGDGLLGMKWIVAVQEDMESRMRQILSVSPTAAAAWKNLLWFYLENKRWDSAVKTARDYFQYYPDDARTAHDAADYLFMHRQFGAVMQVLDPLLRRRPNFKVYQLASWTLGQMGRPEDKARALQLAQTLVEMEPDSPIGYYNLGYIYYWMNRPEQALPAFDRLLTLWPQMPDVEKLVQDLRARSPAVASVPTR